MKKHRALTLAAICLSMNSSAYAAITAHTELFSKDNAVPSGWTALGSTDLSISTGSTQKDDDGTTNASGISLDGFEDGALMINSTAGDGSDIGVTFDIAGTMEVGKQYTLTTRIFNPNLSYINVNVALFNATDSTSLLLSEQQTLQEGSGNYRTLILNYTAQATDAGDTLQLVYRGLAVNSTARDFAIDNVSLSIAAVPEPSTSILLGISGLLLLMRRSH